MDQSALIAALVGCVMVVIELAKQVITRLSPPKQLLNTEDKAQRDQTRTSVLQIEKEVQKLKSNDRDLLRMVSAIEARANESHGVTTEMYKLHSRFDEDGVPLWYVPRSWAATQEEVVKQLALISETQRRVVEALERMERRLEDRSRSARMAKVVVDPNA